MNKNEKSSTLRVIFYVTGLLVMALGIICTGSGVLLRRGKMNQKDFKNKSEMQIFLSYFKPHRKLFLLDMVCALAIALIDLAFPFISRWCMYKLLPDNAWRTFWTVMAVVFCAYILRSVFTYIITYWGHTFGVRIETDFRRDLFQHIQELSYAYFDNARVGQLMSQLTSELFDITEFAHHAPEDIFISTVTIIEIGRASCRERV